MVSQLKDLTVFVGCGRIAHIMVKNGCFVTIRFKDSGQGIAPMSFKNHPDLISNALSEYMKQNPDFEPFCFLGQGDDYVSYYFKRIL